MRQIMGVFSQLEKTRLVKKLKAARDRKRANGKVEGRKSHFEARPEVVAKAKRLHRASPKTGERRSLRKIAAELAALGHLNVNGRPYSAKSVRSMVEGPARARQEAKPTQPIRFRQKTGALIMGGFGSGGRTPRAQQPAKAVTASISPGSAGAACCSWVAIPR